MNVVSRNARGELALSCLGVVMPTMLWTAMLQQSQGQEKGSLILVLEFRALIYSQEGQVSPPGILPVFFQCLFYAFAILKSGIPSTHGKLSWTFGNSQCGQGDSLSSWFGSFNWLLQARQSVVLLRNKRAFSGLSSFRWTESHSLTHQKEIPFTMMTSLNLNSSF